ncbi:MAG: OmpA family protein [Bacteroidota bacterium]|nr:OmpA family protein [Bacteroidota bacterium]
MILSFNFQANLFLIILIFNGCVFQKLNDKNGPFISSETLQINDDKNDELLIDSDNDGVVDKFDLEQNTPLGISVDDSGRSLDLDKDGIPDHIDDDTFSTLGSLVDQNGREIDDDGDGIPNNLDLELNTKNGFCVNNKGQSTNCENAVLPNVFFKPNSSQIDDSNLDRIRVVSSVLRKNEKYKVKVIGYFDFIDQESYNVNLDFKRAEAVFKTLINIFGVDSTRLEININKSKEKKIGNYRKVEFKLF